MSAAISMAERYLVYCATLNCEECTRERGETVEVCAADGGISIAALVEAAWVHELVHHGRNTLDSDETGLNRGEIGP